ECALAVIPCLKNQPIFIQKLFVVLYLVQLKMMNFPLSLTLASKSPRRQYLLQEAGFEHSVVSIDTDEVYPDDLKKDDVARYLAKKKADTCLPELKDNELVSTADTIVILSDRILGKPTAKGHAKQL